MNQTLLVRYGAIPEVARFLQRGGEPLAHGDTVVVRTHRGIELGMSLGTGGASEPAPEHSDDRDFIVLRRATTEDRQRAELVRSESEREYSAWRQRIGQWDLRLELIDLERTLDGEKLILYVLNDRGPECTRLALQAAAAGHGIIEVQPVGLEGLVTLPSSQGSCGTGCGSGGCCN